MLKIKQKSTKNEQIHCFEEKIKLYLIVLTLDEKTVINADFN